MAPKRGGFIDASAAGFRGPLAAALARAGVPVSDRPQTPDEQPGVQPRPRAAGEPDLRRCGKITLRREKKGRGGKTVTVVGGLAFPARQLEQLARELRKALGCGSTVEERDIVLQGDMTDRARAWLQQRGAMQIVIGN